MSGICELALKNVYKNRDETSDVTFIVESEPVRAHRIVLASLSEKYKAQFYGPHADQDDILVEDVTVAAFNEFLRLFYFNEAELSLENIGDVFDLVKQALVDTFLSKCIDFVETTMAFDNKNLCLVYRLINTYDIEPLRKLCEEKISNNTKEVFSTRDFFNCDRETLGRILKLNKLSCREREVFDACISWARADCLERKIDATEPANLRTALGDTIYQVRFGALTLKEFIVRQRKFEGFFTLDETNEIYYLIGKLDGFQSQNFNQTPRDQARILLECHWVDGFEMASRVHKGFEKISFQCNKSILLHGFVIATHFVDPLFVMGTQGQERKEILRFSIKKSANETVVMFNEPINVPPLTLQVISLKVSDLKGRFIYQYYPKRNFESNGTLFTFHDYFTTSAVSRFLFTPN